MSRGGDARAGPRLVLALGWSAALAAWPLPAPTAASGEGGKAVRTLVDLRGAQLVRQHWDLTCGAAAIATLLTYQLGRPVTERQVAAGMLRTTSPILVRARLGFSLLDLKRYVVGQGLAAEGLAGMSLDDLAREAPAIVPIRTHDFRHFVVFRGRRGDRVLLGDPAFGNRTMTTDAFARAWANGIGFVVFDPAQRHAPNRIGAPAELFLAPGDQTLRAATSERSIQGGP